VDDVMSLERITQLRRQYMEAAKCYVAARDATDAAGSVRELAQRACEEAHEDWNSAVEHESECGHALQRAARELESSCDAVFLADCGILSE
jgi:hypothetical protein